MQGAAEVIADPAIDRVVVTDAVPAFRLDSAVKNKKLVILPAPPLLAETIRRLHEERSLTDLLVF
jgi:ribose-phosphate pyrophosphokinase